MKNGKTILQITLRYKYILFVAVRKLPKIDYYNHNNFSPFDLFSSCQGFTAGISICAFLFLAFSSRIILAVPKFARRFSIGS